MRTTLQLPDDLYRQVRLLAAEEGRTITSVFEDALRSYMSNPTLQGAPYRVDAIHPTSPEVRIDAIDAGDNAALRDLMDTADAQARART